MADTKISGLTAVLPSALTTNDYAPIARGASSNGKVDLSLLMPPGFAWTQNAANSAEFKVLSMANDTGFSASAGTVESTTFRLSLGSWNNTDSGQVYSNSGMALGVNCKSANTGAEFRADTTKAALAVYWESNFSNAGYGVNNPHAAESEWGVKFMTKQGVSFSALRFKFGNNVGSTGGSTSPAGEFLADARIGVSGIRGARGCDFLGWTAGGTMGWAANNYDADVFVASIRQNALVWYHDNTVDYPFINMILKQESRYEVCMELGMQASTDPSNNAYNTTTQIPQSYVRFSSRPGGGSNLNASGLGLGLSRESAAKDPLGFSTAILNIYTGNAAVGTKGIRIRGGTRTSGSSQTGDLLEIESTSSNDGTTSPTSQWKFQYDGKLRIGTQCMRTQSVNTSVTDSSGSITLWTNKPGGGNAGNPAYWIYLEASNGTTYYVPAWAS